MPNLNFEKYPELLKANYEALVEAYRRGDFEAEIELPEREGLWPKALQSIGGRKKTQSFKNAAKHLFETAKLLEKELPLEKQDLSNKIKEELAEYKLRADALSYEIADYFLSAENIAEHFENLARVVCKNPQAYYQRHYSFVVTPQAKENIMKQLVLNALCGINAIYRQYDATKYLTGLDYTDDLIEFLQQDFAKFCERENTSFGLLGLAYFLKGRLLLGRAFYTEANDCFCLSAEYYINSLSAKKEKLARHKESRDEGKGILSKADGTEQIFQREASVEVSLSELLAMRRAALALALGSGYVGLISSHVKEANNLLVLARGILHLNSPKVYCYYTELLYWSAKRAANSHDASILLAAKERIIQCRENLKLQVPTSHYPHRASLELSLVLHYLSLLEPANKKEYYKDAIKDLKAAIEFAKVPEKGRKPNKQLFAEASYLLSHLTRYQNVDAYSENPEKSVEDLTAAFKYAREAEAAAENFPRHKCEALLALCGVYADIARRGIKLSDIDPKCKPDADPDFMLKSKALEALRLNQDSNPRISAICYLRLIGHYLRDPNTYSRAYHYWAEWEKIQDSIEHAFVKEWAESTKAKLNETKKRYHVIDFQENADIDTLTEELKASFAKNRIAKWVEETHNQYQLEKRENAIKIVKIKVHKKAGRYASLQGGLESFLEELFKLNNREAKELIDDHSLLDYAERLMKSYLEEK